jgi:hypothetical protein
MFKVNINKIHWNTNKSHNLQDILQVDKILDFFYFQVNGAFQCTCKVPSFSYYYQNAWNF